MVKLEIRYWSKLNICWTEKTLMLGSYAEAIQYIKRIAQCDEIAWAKINDKPAKWEV